MRAKGQLLFLQQVRSVKLTVLAGLCNRNVNPVVAMAVVFPYQMVEQAVVKDKLNVFASDFDSREMDVGCFSKKMFAAGGSSYIWMVVEHWTTEAG